jgi:hypothetical protein
MVIVNEKKGNTWLPVNEKKGNMVTCEGEEGQGHRNGDVDPHHAHLHLVLELAGSCSRLCKYGSAIAVGVCVDQLNCLIQ